MGFLTDESPITEQALAQEYSCSQSTVREALMRLQHNGLVDRRGYEGTFVTSITEEEAVVMVRLRVDLECACMERVVARITGNDFDELQQMDSEYREHRGRRDAYACSEVDRTFHRTLFNISGMPMLEPILSRTLLQLHRYMLSRHEGNITFPRSPHATHAEILDEIRTGEVDAAKAVIKKHIAAATTFLVPDVGAIVFGEETTRTIAANLASA